jgi:hypothetical protein
MMQQDNTINFKISLKIFSIALLCEKEGQIVIQVQTNKILEPSLRHMSILFVMQILLLLFRTVTQYYHPLLLRKKFAKDSNYQQF